MAKGQGVRGSVDEKPLRGDNKNAGFLVNWPARILKNRPG
jgi:hypothetical protein